MEMYMLSAVNTKNRRLYNYGSYLSYGLSGIAVVELIRQGRIAIEDDKLIVKDSSSTRDDLLDKVLQVIADKPAPRKLNSWISLLPYKVKRIDRRVMERLEDNGILRIEQGRFLILFPSRKYIVTNEAERDKIVNVCRDVLFKGDRSPGPEIMLVISVAAASGFIDRFFIKEERKGLKDTFKQLRKGTYFKADTDGIKQVVVAIQRAIAATQAAVGAAGV